MLHPAISRVFARRRKEIGFFCLIAVFMFGRPPLQSQSMSGASIVGSVRDLTDGIPRRSFVCAYQRVAGGYNVCGAVDSLGNFAIRQLLPGTYVISTGCRTVRGGRKILLRRRVDISRPLTRRDWRVATDGCDKRPVRRITGSFRGYYFVGSESGEFRPCPADRWLIPDDSIALEEGSAWVRFNEKASPSEAVAKLADASRDAAGDHRFYVTFRGTIVGPDDHGMKGVTPFMFLVDSVERLRRRSTNDCR
jgi:hypothetical protein